MPACPSSSHSPAVALLHQPSSSHASHTCLQSELLRKKIKGKFRPLDRSLAGHICRSVIKPFVSVLSPLAYVLACLLACLRAYVGAYSEHQKKRRTVQHCFTASDDLFSRLVRLRPCELTLTPDHCLGRGVELPALAGPSLA